MGRWKALIPVFLALVIALSGSLLLYKWLKIQRAPKEEVKVEDIAVPIVVADLDLAWGTKLSKDMFKIRPFLKDSLPPGHFTDSSVLEGKVLISALKKNEPIIESKLAQDDVSLGGVSAIIKPDKRAVSLKGDMIIGVSGFIRPGNRVDVIATLVHPKTDKESTKVILENLLVLATGTQIHTDGKGHTAPVDVYTLEVTPEEAERLALSANLGKLQLALRNTTDAKTVLTRGTDISKTLSSYMPKKAVVKRKKKRVAQKVEKAEPVEPIKPLFVVEVIKGNVSEKKEMDLTQFYKE